MRFDGACERRTTDRATALEGGIDDLQSDVGAATAVPLRTDERGSPTTRMQGIVRRGALARSAVIVLGACHVLAAKIAQVDDVVDAAFPHADAAAPIGAPAPRRLHRMIRAKSVQLAARVRSWLRARFAARVHGAAGQGVKVGFRHTPIVQSAAGNFSIERPP